MLSLYSKHNQRTKNCLFDVLIQFPRSSRVSEDDFSNKLKVLVWCLCVELKWLCWINRTDVDEWPELAVAKGKKTAPLQDFYTLRKEAWFQDEKCDKFSVCNQCWPQSGRGCRDTSSVCKTDMDHCSCILSVHCVCCIRDNFSGHRLRLLVVCLASAQALFEHRVCDDLPVAFCDPRKIEEITC